MAARLRLTVMSCEGDLDTWDMVFLVGYGISGGNLIFRGFNFRSDLSSLG